MELETEKRFRCPFCNERISMLLDLSESGEQSYVEDCEVCCKPIQISFSVENSQLVSFAAQAAF